MAWRSFHRLVETSANPLDPVAPLAAKSLAELGQAVAGGRLAPG